LATVTSNPRYAWLTKPIVDFGRSGIGRFLLPFSKTASNVLEGSLERTPGIGVLMHMTQKAPELKATIAEIAAQQGMGGLVSVGSYLLGANIDPTTARELKWPLLITNLSGQYGALAGAAFAAGQMSQYDESPVRQAASGAQSMIQDLPLPSAAPLTGLVQAGAAYGQGEPPNPQAESPIQQWLPNLLTPRFMRDQFQTDLDNYANELDSLLNQ